MKNRAEKERLIRERYPTGDLYELSEQLNMSRKNLMRWAHRLGVKRIKRKKRERVWKFYEIETLKNNHGVVSVSSIAKALNRPIDEIDRKIKQLGL